MVYCSNCGIIMDVYDCPVCGFTNFKSKEPGKDEVASSKVNEIKQKPTTPVRRPASHKNSPKKSAFMLAGSIGSFMIAISAIVLGILPLYLMIQQNDWMEFESFGIFLLFIIATIMFLSGSAVLMGGLYGLFKHYGSYRGLVALIFSLISPIILLIFTILAIENVSYENYYSSYNYYRIGNELWIGHLFIGIMFIIIGLSWRNIYYKIGLDQPNVPVGSMFVLAGFLFMAYVGMTGLPWIIISIAGFSSGVLFLLARMGTDEIPDGRPKYRPHWTSMHSYPPPPNIDSKKY